MKRNMTMRVAACAVAFVAISAFGTELTHRWSFNGDWSDSVGGADAVKCGSYVSLYGGRVHMGYGACLHGTGYVNFGMDYYIAATFEQQGDGATLVKWQRRDAATGGLLTSGTLLMAGGINSFVNPVLYLGA